jgi:OOP family OmpA-OmpF porin
MRCPDAVIEISGHTDSVGNDDTNSQLSQRRAEEVSEYLKKAGVGAERMTAVGYGKTRPVASNDTEEGRARNRRIEFDVK